MECKYKGNVARKLAEAAEAFRKELNTHSHGDDFWQLKRQVREFASRMRRNGTEGDESNEG